MNNRPQTCDERRNNAAFTLVELIIVVVIILLISILVLPTVLGALNDRKYSDAANTIQAVFIGARDRAIQSGNVVGVRLIRDNTDAFDVSQLIYVAVPEPYAVGRVTVSGTTVSPDLLLGPDPHFDQVAPGNDGTVGTFDDIARVVPGLSSIRFDFAGKLYPIAAIDTSSTPARLTLGMPVVTLTDPTSPHQYQLFGPPVPMAQADAVLLPQGMVIDVREAPIQYLAPYSATQTLNIPRSSGIPNAVPPVFAGLDLTYGTTDDIHWLGSDRQLGTSDDLPAATWPHMDILFAPNGQVTGIGAAQPLIHFWVGERGDKGPDPTTSRGADNLLGTKDDVRPTRRCMLLTLNTRTGTMHVLHEPATGSVDTWPPTTGLETYSEIYRPAEQLLGVSVLP
jgi:type II secretory pathway pseudopilin PulG